MRKVKTKLSLPEDLLRAVDRIAEWASASRSATVALLLRGAIGGPPGGPPLAVDAQLGVQVGAPQEGPTRGPHTPHTPQGTSSLDASDASKKLDDTRGGLGGQGPRASVENPGPPPSPELPLWGTESPVTASPAEVGGVGSPKATRPTRGLLCVLAEEAFGNWWRAYPRRVAKQAGRRAYRSALIRCGWSGQARDGVTFVPAAATILEGAKRYMQACHGKEMRFVRYPATWLNASCWEDSGETDQVLAPGKVSANTSARAEFLAAQSRREALERKRQRLQVLEERLEDGEALSPQDLVEVKRLRGIVGGAC